jgi:hypothetical protein
MRNAAQSGVPGAAGTTRWMRATCATCPGTTIPGLTIRHWLGLWAARSRARPGDRAARAAAVCGSATSSRIAFLPIGRCTAKHGTAASRLWQRICRGVVFRAVRRPPSVGASTLPGRAAHTRWPPTVRTPGPRGSASRCGVRRSRSAEAGADGGPSGTRCQSSKVNCRFAHPAGCRGVAAASGRCSGRPDPGRRLQPPLLIARAGYAH